MEEAVKVPGSIPRAAAKKRRFSPSLCDLDRDARSTYRSRETRAIVAINYCTTDDFAKARGQSRAEYGAARTREEEDV